MFDKQYMICIIASLKVHLYIYINIACTSDLCMYVSHRISKKKTSRLKQISAPTDHEFEKKHITYICIPYNIHVYLP